MRGIIQFSYSDPLQERAVETVRVIRNGRSVHDYGRLRRTVKYNTIKHAYLFVSHTVFLTFPFIQPIVYCDSARFNQARILVTPLLVSRRIFCVPTNAGGTYTQIDFCSTR